MRFLLSFDTFRSQNVSFPADEIDALYSTKYRLSNLIARFAFFLSLSYKKYIFCRLNALFFKNAIKNRNIFVSLCSL